MDGGVDIISGFEVDGYKKNMVILRIESPKYHVFSQSEFFGVKYPTMVGPSYRLSESPDQ